MMRLRAKCMLCDASIATYADSIPACWWCFRNRRHELPPAKRKPLAREKSRPRLLVPPPASARAKKGAHRMSALYPIGVPSSEERELTAGVRLGLGLRNDESLETGARRVLQTPANYRGAEWWATRRMRDAARELIADELEEPIVRLRRAAEVLR